MGPHPAASWREQLLGIKLESSERERLQLSAQARLVACVFAEFVNRHTELGWPSVTTLAQCSGLSESSVRRALRELEREGWLHTTSKGGGNSRSTTRRRIHTPVPLTPVTQTGVSQGPGPLSEGPPTPVCVTPEPEREPETNRAELDISSVPVHRTDRGAPVVDLQARRSTTPTPTSRNGSTR